MRTVLVTLGLLLASPSCASPARSPAQRAAFVKANPCPKSCATYVKRDGKFVLYARCGACDVDHICPLACGGADRPANMHWLDHKANLSKGADCGACR